MSLRHQYILKYCQHLQSKEISTPRVLCNHLSQRFYISRAHPPKEGLPQYPIADALAMVLSGVEERKQHRATRWDRNRPRRIAKLGVDIVAKEEPYRNQDETIELALNLNLDPRKPGQSLRGSLPLPYGTGKKVKLIVFTSDSNVAQQAMAAGATLAGGTDLIQSILEGTVPIASFDRSLATPDMMTPLSKVARILGPRGLMPNAKLNTIRPADSMVAAVREQTVGLVQYRTEKNAIIHAPLGKGSFTGEQILDNIRAFMNGMQNVKPDSFGKAKKKPSKGGSGSGGGKGAKYYLSAHLTATQGKGSIPVDLRTMDVSHYVFYFLKNLYSYRFMYHMVCLLLHSWKPTSPFFMGVAPNK